MCKQRRPHSTLIETRFDNFSNDLKKKSINRPPSTSCLYFNLSIIDNVSAILIKPVPPVHYLFPVVTGQLLLLPPNNHR